MITIERMIGDDVIPVASQMREADKIEVRALSGHSPYAALMSSYYSSFKAWTVFENDNPIACFGYVLEDLIEGRGQVWFLGTDRVSKNARAFVELSKFYMDEMQKVCPLLYNTTHQQNFKAKLLLKKLGFEFGTPFKVGEHEFVPFCKDGRDVNV